MKKGMALLLTSLCAGAMVVALSPNEAEAAHRRIITDAPKAVAAKEAKSAEVKQESKAEESSENVKADFYNGEIILVNFI